MANNNCTIEEALQKVSSCFEGAGLEQPRDEAEILLAHFLGWDRLKLFLGRSQVLENKIRAAFETAAVRRAGGEPLAYITGSKEFYGLQFALEPGVLIPRPETELIVDAILEWARSREGDIRGIDLGSGSGNLAVALAYHLPQAIFYAVDISAEALQLAASNAVRHGVSGRIFFRRGCYFQALSGMEPPPGFNLVVANPPYLTAAEIGSLPPSIRAYEPRLALNGGPDGLAGYRSILNDLSSHILGPGLAALEVDSSRSGAIYALCRGCGIFHRLTLLRDYQDLPRVLLGLF